ncbi:glycosyltransferase family 2 protein [Hymenobacter sp. BT683]|uniref:Glycosyltransferase family 2 protein n=1 Tax=Hymenobacter jeongseonensis TaxID=2791027 RepID=A0ABS0IEJ0_9BACT|nr:glycosyltransferase [Hymenobacter jeongseonensis]MBF9236752.1 glycosyltransferase family 2 protein [Hymenobacter jeongseonensis]
MNRNPEGVSVVICCYNSSTRLPETLLHLSRQEFKSAVPWEILIIDNGSTDNTFNFALNEWSKINSNVPFSVISEPTPGTAAARETGIQKSKYEFILFCDDDNWLISSYVETAYEAMVSNKSIAALGGQGKAVCETTPPKWFEKFKQNYATGPQGRPGKPSEISLVRGFLYTAGSVFRKSCIENLWNQSYRGVCEGRTGKNLNGSEDVELCYNIILNGGHIYYDERLVFEHYMTSPRLTWPYYKKMVRGFGKGFSFTMPYKLLINKESKRFAMGISWLYISALYLILKNVFIAIPKSFFKNNYLVVRADLESNFAFLVALIENHTAIVALYKNLSTAPWIADYYKPHNIS